jgi:hypothetical protein
LVAETDMSSSIIQKDNMKWRGGNKKVTLLNCSIVDLPLYFE